MLNPDPIKIREFLSNFASIWPILGQFGQFWVQWKVLKVNLEKNSKKIQLLAKKFKDWLKKHETGTKFGFDWNSRILEQFWGNLGNFGSNGKFGKLTFENNSIFGQKIQKWLKMAPNPDFWAILGQFWQFWVQWSFGGLQSSLRPDKAKNALKWRELEKT